MTAPKTDTQKQASVASSAGKMGAATLISRVLGLVREQVFAFLFGASDAADAFNIAFRIPNLLRDLFAEGAMSSAFVPNFTKTLMESKLAAYRLLASVLSILFVGLGALSILGMYYSSEIVAMYAGSYSAVPGKVELTVSLTRMMFPFFPLVAMAAVTMGALNALGHFFLPAFAPVLFNVAAVICGLFLTPLLVKYTDYPPIYSMGIAVVLGGFLQFYIQWWQIKRVGLNPKDLKDAFLKPFSVPQSKQVLWLLIPGTLGLAATQLNILINSIYATSCGSGAVSWLNYAFRLMQFPIGVFGVSLAAATLPAVTRKLVSGDPKLAAQELQNSLKLSFAINGPAAAGLMAAGLPIIQMIFEHGKFGFSDSQQTTRALFWYAMGLPAYSVVKVIVPVFYAMGRTRIPVIVSFAAVGLNLFCNHLFLDVLHYEFWALALATSATATLNALVLCGFLVKLLPGSVNLSLGGSLLIHTLLSIFVGAGSFSIVVFIARFEQMIVDSAGKFVFWSLQTSAAIFAALVVWIIAGKLLRVRELEQVVGLVRKKLGNRKN